MGTPTRFIPHSLNINTGAGTSAWIDQVQSASPAGGVQLFEESAGSETDREFVAAQTIGPTVAIVTSELGLLATIGFAGLAINSGAAKPGVMIFGRELPLGALPTAIATANHLKMTVSDGLLVPESIQAAHNSVARLTLTLHAILGTDATSGAKPIVIAKAQAITAGAGAVSSLFTAGPVKYDARLVSGITNLSVSFGIQVLKEGSDGDVYPSHVSIIGRMSRIVFTTKDGTLAADVGDGISISTFACYFRGVAANGQRVAPAATTHISIAGTAGMITPGDLTLQHGQAAAGTYTYTPAKNTNLLTISTAAAIPTT